MAFEIGERVLSKWAGPGTIESELKKDEDRVCYQTVKFDSALIGTKDWPLNKLEPYEDPKPKGRRKVKVEVRSEDGS